MAHEEHHIEIDGEGMSEEKLERIKGKIDTFMGDLAAELVDEETQGKIMKTVQKKMKDAGVASSLTYIKAFMVGLEMGIGAPDTSVQMAIAATVRSFIQNKQADIDKKVKDAGV